MKNVKLWLGLLIILPVLFITGCDLFVEMTVPKWAQGSWSLIPESNILLQPEAVKITSKEFIPADDFNAIPGITRTDVTLAGSNEVIFDFFKVSKGDSANQIKLGLVVGGDTITLYKR